MHYIGWLFPSCVVRSHRIENFLIDITVFTQVGSAAFMHGHELRVTPFTASS